MGQKWVAPLRLLGIGWYIGICILLGTLGGRWLGQKLDIEVFLTIVGAVVGVVVAFVGVYRMLGLVMDNRRDKGEE